MVRPQALRRSFRLMKDPQWDLLSMLAIAESKGDFALSRGPARPLFQGAVFTALSTTLIVSLPEGL